MKKLRVAIIGMEHCHVHGMVHQFYEDTDIVGIASYRNMPQDEYDFYVEHHIPKDKPVPIYENYKELLEQNIDIAIVCTAVRDHADAVCEILARDIHVIVEKPFAFDMEDAKKMYRAYKNSKAELIVNWPVAWFSGFNKAKELADSGKIGTVHKVQYRSP
ncbi:MAG: Gfo/Idh/MocA family oxidoreductase, partial [Clostridia bacterium]|nr:Gfo/Idh/MocA family oxidoreductase [Clostridia bacterium]